MDFLFFIVPIIIVASIIVGFVSHTNTKNIELLETATSLNRGNWSERDLVLKLLKHEIPAGAIFHDIYIRNNNNTFAQIDLVVPTKVGIIVFEIKDYNGWIFGNGRQNQWTACYKGGRFQGYQATKHRFYNPILQNNKHIIELKRILRYENVPFYSVIVFYGDCELKDVSFVPQGTFITSAYRVLNVVDSIINDNKIANYTDKRNIINVLTECVKNGESTDVKEKHIKNIQNMIGKGRIFY